MEQDPLWYKNAIIYQLHVRSFYDSTGDGVGDFRGLHEKLGHFEELGVTALWLLPFYPSPLRDDGYDIADYYSVNPAYGKLEDFQRFLAEAHRRNLRIITEIVINHTSDQHEWFQRARRAPAGSPERDFYVWSDTPKRFEEARIIFKDFETSNWSWDPVAQAYYWHRFYSHQPDLNYDNPLVLKAVDDVVDFWLGMGVDGVRLDAIPYLVEREGTSCENLPETHAILRDLRRHIDERFPGRMLLAEANQWPEDAVAYFGSGDECHMAFHFPLMPRLFMALQMEDRFPIIDILEQTPEIPVSCQWAIFLRNHDELTLEMVTDEERDYMYRIYADDPRARINLGIRRRLAPLLGNNRRKIELISSLLLSLPGTPIIYYGDEIGMGDNIYLGDRNGVRTPMQWSADRNAGFSRANPQQLFLPVIIDPQFHYEAINVDMQEKNASSLLWWMQRILAVRQRHKAFSQGTIEFLRPANQNVLAFLRTLGEETILVVANLSRFSQAVQIELSAFKGRQAQELFGGGPFMEISDGRVFFTVGPHGFYWLLLKAPAAAGIETVERAEPPLELEPAWSEELLHALQAQILPGYLPKCRWFGQKQRTLRNIKVVGGLTDKASAGGQHVFLVELAFAQGDPVTQILPLYLGKEDEGDLASAPAVVARFSDRTVLWDALYVRACRERVWDIMARGEAWGEPPVELFGVATDAIKGVAAPTSRLVGGEQSNTTIAFGEEYLLKFLRRFDPGPHPDADIIRALGERKFPHVPRYAGEIRCRVNGEEGVLALLTTFVKNQGDGWTYALDAISRYFDRVLASRAPETADADALMGGVFRGRARQLGERTAELHRCLESIVEKPDFAPEPFTSLYQRSLYQSMRTLLRRTELAMTQKLPDLDKAVRDEAEGWLALAPRILSVYSKMLRTKISATKIRVHGDYHLGQVLNTGNDFVILDFEGEPKRSPGERLLKRSPLVDVAGMLRSFDYAVEASVLKQRVEDRERLRPWAALWLDHTSRAFLEAYLEVAKGASFLPQRPEDLDTLLKAYLLDKAVYEIGYELNYRPSFLPIPVGAAKRLLGAGEQAARM